LATDPEVQVVYIGSVHPLHKANAILCMKNGKSVLCEKPLAMNTKEVEEMIAVAKANKVFYMEGMWTRYFPAMDKVKEIIDSGILGEIKSVMVDFGFKDNGTPRLVEKDLGGGALLDIGVYVISFASFVFGGKFPDKIKAVGVLLPTQVDESVSMSLEYGSKLATLFISIGCEVRKEAVIFGDKARLTIKTPFWCPTNVVLNTADGKEQTWNFSLPQTTPESSFNFINSAGFMYEAQYVHKMLKEGKLESDKESLHESLNIMKTMDEVRKQIGVSYPQDK